MCLRFKEMEKHAQGKGSENPDPERDIRASLGPKFLSVLYIILSKNFTPESEKKRGDFYSFHPNNKQSPPQLCF